jgi:O-antigen/teichoic acid export membrane protein
MIQRLKPKTEFSRNVLKLMTGTTIAQAIPISITPILTRMYTPEDFGLLALFVAITSTFGVIANGRFELAILLPEKDEDAVNIGALGLLIALFFSAILLVLVILFNNEIKNILGSEEIGFWLYFIPFVVFMMGLFNILNYLNLRKKYYNDIAKANVYKSVGMASIQLGVGFIKSGVMGLISGQIVAQIIANYRLSKNILKNYNINVSRIEVIRLFKRYKFFPLFSVPSVFVNAASLQAPILILNYFFNQSAAGFLSLSIRVISMPVSLIGTSIGQVFFQQVSLKVNGKEDISSYVKSTLMKLVVIGVLPFSVLVAYSDILFPYVFGEQWGVAGAYAQYLSIWLFFLFIHSPLTPLFEVYERQKVGLVFTASLLFARVFSMILIYFLFKEALYVIVAYSMMGILFNVIILWYLLRLSKLKPLGILLKIIFTFIFTVLVILSFKQGLIL